MNPYNKFPDRVNVCIEIIDELGGEQDYLYKNPNYTIEDQVWEIAKNYDSMPNFNNIYYGIVFDELENLVNEKYPEFEIEFFHNVNDCASDMSFRAKSSDSYAYKDIVDKDEFFDILTELKFENLEYGLNNVTAERALDTLLESVNDKESIALNYNGNDLIQVSKSREAFQIGNEIYDLIYITYKDEMLELVAKPEKDKYGDFEYKVVRIDEVSLRETEAIIDTDIPYVKIGVDDINLSVKDEVLQRATEFMDKINKEHSLLLNDTSAMENLRKDNKSVLYDSLTALDDENATILKDLTQFRTPELMTYNENYSRAGMVSVIETGENEYSLKIVSDMKTIKSSATTYGGEETNFDFVIHNDKILVLNASFADEPFQSNKTFDDKGIADINEQRKATLELTDKMQNLLEKYQLKEKLEQYKACLNSETNSKKDENKNSTRKQR